MSGIAGIIRFDGAPIEPGLVEKMTAAMAHRGPDGIRHWRKGSVALGQCMLRTTPESLEETQPLTNEDESLVLVMDGRVDNWEELRRELRGRGVELRNRSDAELVLRAYETWGRECLPQIDGDFALVIWDERRKTVFCARDRMGNKPFHYHWDGNTLTFSSELHAVLTMPWVARKPNQGILAEFIAAEWHTRDETIWQGVMRLVAAHRLDVSAKGLSVETYWAPDLWATLPFKQEEEYAEHYREILLDTVRRMSRSNQPVAFEVSGGLDSSAVFCIAEHLRRKGQLPAPAIGAYSLAFNDNSEANELIYSRAIGEYLGKTVHEVLPSEPPLSWYEENARQAQNFPGFANGAMHLALHQRASADGARVLVTGSGGDEWLCGERTYYAEALAGREWRALYALCTRDAAAYGAGKVAEWLVRDGVMPLLPRSTVNSLRWARTFLHGGMQRPVDHWMSPQLKSLHALRRRRAREMPSHRIRRQGQRRQLAFLFDAFNVHATEATERLGARNGLEGRNPLRAAALVQFSFSTPERLRRQGDIDKYLHRRALDGLMPDLVRDRQSKAEFSSVVRRQIDQMEAVLTEQIPQRRSAWINERGIHELFRAYQNNHDAGWPLWPLWNIWSCDVLLPAQ